MLLERWSGCRGTLVGRENGRFWWWEALRIVRERNKCGREDGVDGDGG